MGSPTKTNRHTRSRSAHRISALLGCTALVALPHTALAQDADDTGAYRLSPIVVDLSFASDNDDEDIVAKELWTGGKVATSLLDTPASVSVVTQKEIRQRNADKVEDVLEYSTGMHTDFWGSDDRNDYYQARGFSASTFRDGLSLGSMRGVREEPYAFERLEVIKGGNSTLFGTSAPGATINFVSKSPKYEKFGEVYGSYGSFNQTEVGFDFGDVVNEEGTLAYRVVGKIQDSELEYPSSKDDEQFFLGSVSYKPTDRTELTFSVDYLKRDGTPNSGGYPFDRTYERTQFFGEPSFNYHDVERLTVSAGLQHEFDNGLRLTANLRHSGLTDNFGYLYINDTTPRTGTMVNRDLFGGNKTSKELIGNAILQYDTMLGSIGSSTLAGVEFRKAENSESGFYQGAYDQIDVANPVYSGSPTIPAPYSDQTNQYETKSLFLQQNLSFSDRLIATVGVRHDWLDITTTDNLTATSTQGSFSETSYRAALTYKFTDSISTYASFVQSISPPSTGLVPERGRQYEMGVKYQPAGINALFTAAVYDLTKVNERITIPNAGGGFTRQTIGESRTRGVELEARGDLGSGLNFSAAYTYQKSEFVRGGVVSGANIDGNELATVPNHIASLWLNYDLPTSGRLGDISVGLGARLVGSYYYNANNTGSKSPVQTYVDASFSYGFAENTDLTINVSNLFDKQYVVNRGTAAYYNEGRKITAALRHSW